MILDDAGSYVSLDILAHSGALNWNAPSGKGRDGGPNVKLVSACDQYVEV